MTYAGDLSEHLGLFILEFVANPQTLTEHGKAAGITHDSTVELAAWCAELNEQLRGLAANRGIELQLMGGNAASLRLDVAAQRGSRDNDYLTTATEAEVDDLVHDLATRFAGMPGHLMQPKRISAAGKMPLPLASYTVEVPSLTVGLSETLEAKLEFHLEDELPPSEQVTGRLFPLGQQITNTIPALPYQVGLKLIVFDDPPIGIPEHRESAIPRQMHDVDLLADQMTDPAHWAALGPYVRRRYEKEQQFQGLELQPDAPWLGIARRMDDWASCDTDVAKWDQITRFQTAQIGRATRRPVGDWRARARRIQTMAATAASDRTDLYLQALDLEKSIDTSITGKTARGPRAALGEVMGPHWDASRKQLNGYGLRTTYWEAVAVAADLETRLEELRQVLA